NLVGTDRHAHTAAADRDATIHLPRHHGLGERDDEVRIIVARVQTMRPKIDSFMPRPVEMCNQLVFQTKSTMIHVNSHSHSSLLTCIQSAVLLPRGRPTPRPALGEPARRELTHRRRGGDGTFLPSHSRSQPKVPG